MTHHAQLQKARYAGRCGDGGLIRFGVVVQPQSDDEWDDDPDDGAHGELTPQCCLRVCLPVCAERMASRLIPGVLIQATALVRTG